MLKFEVLFKVEVRVFFPKLKKDLARILSFARVPSKGDKILLKGDGMSSVPPVESVLLIPNPQEGGVVAEIEVNSEGASDEVFYDNLKTLGWKSSPYEV